MSRSAETEPGSGPGRAGVWVLGLAAGFLVVWWWFERQGTVRGSDVKLVLGAVWSALLIAGVLLAYGRR